MFTLESDFYNIRLADCEGRIIWQLLNKEVPSGSNIISLTSLGFLSPGIYLLEISSNNQFDVIKLIKQ